MTNSETIFPFMCKKMSRIVTISACIVTSVMTWYSASKSIIDNLENAKNTSICVWWPVKIESLRQYLWLDFRCRAKQEIVSNSSKYQVLLRKRWNECDKYQELFAFTNPNHHLTKSLMADMFERSHTVQATSFPKKYNYFFPFACKLWTYRREELCFETILFVFKIEWMKPFEHRVVQAKCDVRTFANRSSKVT